MPTGAENLKLLKENRPDLFIVNSQFAPKLSYADRCAVLAFSKGGVKTPVLAVAFGINRSTVRHITNPASKHYRDVRKEYNEHDEAFINKYATDDWTAKVQAATKAEEARTSEDAIDKAKRQVRKEKIMRASGAEGKHKITHRVGKDVYTGTLDIVFLKEGDNRLGFGVDGMDSGPLTEGWYGIYDEDGAQEIGTMGAKIHNSSSTEAYKFIMTEMFMGAEEL